MAAFSEAALISKEVFVEIHVYQRQGMSLRKIAAEVGCAVNTVRRYLAASSAPKYERKVERATKLGPYKDYVRQRQAAAHPHWIPATVLQREITEQGYVGGLTKLRAVLRTLRPVQPTEPVVRFRSHQSISADSIPAQLPRHHARARSRPA